MEMQELNRQVAKIKAERLGFTPFSAANSREERIMDILFLWYGENAIEVEKLAWEHFSRSESLKDAEFLGVETREQFEAEHERLTKEGWMLRGVGSGSWARISSYSKSEV